MALGLLETVLLSTILCGTLSSLAYYKRVLTLDGTLAAFAVGMVIGILGDVTWLFLLLFFLLSSFLATRYRFALKEAMGVQEGTKGERRASNVLANGAAPVAVAVLSSLGLSGFPKDLSGVVFLAALAVAGADTLASEIGVLSRKAYLITTLRPVTPGTDGGISTLGQMCALAAALYTALVGYLVLAVLARAVGLPATMPLPPAYLAIPALVGFLGCQLDSVIGATLERKGYVNKKMTNLIATSFGGILGYALLAVV